MRRFRIAVVVLLLGVANASGEAKTPVSVSRTGEDRVGTLFVAALNRELLHSMRYQPMPSEGTENGLRFYVELATIGVGKREPAGGNRSAVSVVVEEMGLPNSFPVAAKWHHKVVVVDETTAGKVAKELIDDMDASWCSHIRSSVGGCPKETLYPRQ